MNSRWKTILITIIILVIAIGIAACCYNSQSIKRLGKDIKSDLSGGLNRTVTVYTADGEILKTYKGKIDLETTEGGIVKFDLNGQRIMYYNCYVEVIENIGKEQTMKFLVNELPDFYDDCPFSKEEWKGEGWVAICT